MHPENEDSIQQHARHGKERPQDTRASQAETNEADEATSETAKDINVVRGDDRPQSVRHSG